MTKIPPVNGHVKPRASRNRKADFYKLCRKWHGYLSAFAFAALFFFAVTGIMLNHPDWFANDLGDQQAMTVTLPPQLLSSSLELEAPPTAITDFLKDKALIVGSYVRGEIADGSAYLFFESIRGSTDITINLDTGRAEINLARTKLSMIIQELHRGTKAGGVWQLFIDAAAILIIALSVIGFLLFFSLRLRLKSSLALVIAGLALMAGLFVIVIS